MTGVRDLDFQMEQRKWSAEEIATLERLWKEHGGGFRKIGRLMGRSHGSISGKSRVLGLQFNGHRGALPIARNNLASVNAESIYPARVIDPDSNVLKSGDNQRKLGKVVKKGAWKGMPIFSLTLEERATCPRSCPLWLGCYGNGMGHAKRYRHGPALEARLWSELWILQHRHPDGFVVRLHILGDFYSVSYVDLWEAALDHFPALHVFGYTARQEGARIGDAIAHLRREHWARFAVRTSGASIGPASRYAPPARALGRAPWSLTARKMPPTRLSARRNSAALRTAAHALFAGHQPQKTNPLRFYGIEAAP